MTAPIAWDLPLVHGRCVAVALPAPSREPDLDDLLARLHEEERAYAEGLAFRRRHGWVGGRVALRAALDLLDIDVGPIFSTPRGAPAVPDSVSASLSHKETVAVALLARADGWTRGVDVEYDRPRSHDLSRHVLAPGEIAELASLSNTERAREVLLRFSIKEAIYKAIDPHLGRYVAFREVSARPRENGHVELAQQLDDGTRFELLEATWLRRDGLIVSTARAGECKLNR